MTKDGEFYIYILKYKMNHITFPAAKFSERIILTSRSAINGLSSYLRHIYSVCMSHSVSSMTNSEFAKEILRFLRNFEIFNKF